MRKLGIVLLVAALLATCAPVLTLAYSTDGDSCAQAKTDAATDSSGSKWLWFAAGLLFNFLGVAGGYLIPMSVPINRIMGKSADYVSNYTVCYQEQTKSENGMMAIWGCVVGSVVYIVIFVIVVVAFAATVVSSYTYY